MSKKKMNEEVEKNYKKIRMDINRIVHTELAKLEKKAPEGEEIPPLF